MILCGLLLLAGCSTLAPNPLFPDPYTAGGAETEIIFTDLPASCTIEIYSVNGERIRTIIESDGDGQAAWDIKNESGEAVQSGLYNYIIKSSEGEKKGKLIIKK